jgi:hypothetical protein
MSKPGNAAFKGGNPRLLTHASDKARAFLRDSNKPGKLHLAKLDGCH